ncbi:fatty-acid amide hydrolase 2-A [Thrips palmi]|uniref:Fatty-acid amide hydrolase 2-A n=1 Tax=Thrips palmi TaxID=161013 RepID=A0A6P8XTS4_THRPL|nr:fatty-acid amide hydrolase 2-A [Thrips palmi]XP_034230310.1 fatty-acid amide hydrolase 2-A [Thrips palmi]XP_034230311.1 fatty-acid amide hydrolase 2-A [Thrips palmi]
MAGSTTNMSVRSFKHVAARVFHRVVELIARALFSIVYFGSKDKVSPINNMLLLESASSLAFKIRTQKVTSVEVVQSFIDRINETNPIINGVVDTRFSAALEEAKAADELIASGLKSETVLAKEKPFLGVPFTTKECLQSEGLCHCAGLYKRRCLKGTKDADAVAHMKRAGAILLAVTNVSELAMWWESHNYVHGRSRNSYDTSRIVGGSSGGEGTVLSAGASPIGIGSDIGGSIRMPAFFNGIFGHKPSKFIVSNEGQFPCPSDEEHSSFLGLGPMSRFASDLLPTLRVIADKNASKLKLDEKIDMKKIKVFYAEDDGGSFLISPVDPDIKASLRNVITYLEKAHGIKAQKVSLDLLRISGPIWLARMKSRGISRFAQELSNNEGNFKVGWELVKWLLCMSRHTLIALFTVIMEGLGEPYGSPKHQHLVEKSNQLEMQINDLLGNDGVFLYPTHPTPAPYHNEPLIKPFNFSYSAIFNIMGFPATAIPLGLGSEGLPIGIQAVGTYGNDHLTIAMAVELEKAFGGWVAPSVSV